MEDPNVPELLRSLVKQDLTVDPEQATFLLSRNTVLRSRKGFLGRLLDGLFILMARNALVATRFFHLPANRVIEIGMQIEI